MEYTHLTMSERFHIMFLRQCGRSPSAIARILGRHRSTISREIHKQQESYEAEKAHARARQIKCQRRRHKLDEGPLREHVIRHLLLRHSPDQIAGRLKSGRDGLELYVSHQSIYTFIYEQRKLGVDYSPYLRFGKRKHPRKVGGKPRHERIRDARSIDERPANADSKREFGHFELDSVCGPGYRGKRIGTAVESKTKYLIAFLVNNRKARTYNQACALAFQAYDRLPVKSFTVDNGMEFSKHKEMEEWLGTRVYFAHPHCAWERGLNENTNGLLRQFVPKQTDLSALAPEQLQAYVEEINNRPRKCLGYRTPAEAFALELVALRS